jgi:thioredoxin reductase (NADPH)
MEILFQLSKSMKKEYQTIIIGAGPAGISCGAELQESKIDYLILDRNDATGGQLLEIPNTIRDFAGGFFEDGQSLKARMDELAGKVGLNLALKQDVSSVNLKEGFLIANDQKLTARSIVLATGVSRRKLNLDNADTFGDDLAYVLWGCKEHFSDNPVAVVGGGDSALLDALELASLCPVVYLIHRSIHFKARPDVLNEVRNNPRIRLVADTQVESLIGNGSLTGVRLVSTATEEKFDIEVNRLLIKVGYAPNTEIFSEQVKMNSSGYIICDKNQSTSLPGVYAAGDITAGGYWRLAVAIGQGSLAGYNVRQYLGEA